MSQSTLSPGDVHSPLVSGGATTLISRIPVSWIVEQYRQQYDIDVASSFRNVGEVRIYECKETGFRFYTPESVAGEESFYRLLARFPWFYQAGKWEHGIALEFIDAGQRVLDVGCGTGHFLRSARDAKHALVTGIELNQEAATTAKKEGIEVVSELITDHAGERPGYYDVICTFQVLEHVSRPLEFLSACLRALKPSGLFIVGVPNNDGFLKFDPTAILNGPPHHMGLWTRRSLTSLTQLFPIDLVRVELEPLKEVDWYQAVMEQRYLPKRWMRSLFYRIGGATLFHTYLTENASTIAGHTILVVYKKQT